MHGYCYDEPFRTARSGRPAMELRRTHGYPTRANGPLLVGSHGCTDVLAAKWAEILGARADARWSKDNVPRFVEVSRVLLATARVFVEAGPALEWLEELGRG